MASSSNSLNQNLFLTYIGNRQWDKAIDHLSESSELPDESYVVNLLKTDIKAFPLNLVISLLTKFKFNDEINDQIFDNLESYRTVTQQFQIESIKLNIKQIEPYLNLFADFLDRSNFPPGDYSNAWKLAHRLIRSNPGLEILDKLFLITAKIGSTFGFLNLFKTRDNTLKLEGLKLLLTDPHILLCS